MLLIKVFVEQQINNLHDEVSELHEAVRDGTWLENCDKADKMLKLGLRPLSKREEEYADIIIRVLDQCKRLNVDIVYAISVKHAYNTTREYKHGKKF
jgi:NTP pyrophosphatase (non-canonical NTP hydrolase)